MAGYATFFSNIATVYISNNNEHRKWKNIFIAIATNYQMHNSTKLTGTMISAKNNICTSISIVHER
jgi:hypothetical protein